MFGLIAALFFSSTFVLNHQMASANWHWFNSAALRYAWTIVILTIWITAMHGPDALRQIRIIFLKRWSFWMLCGTIGFGLFYAPLCYAASQPGWVTAATWQMTIIATPIVLRLFGEKIAWRCYLFSAIIVAGIMLANWSPESGGITAQTVIHGILPVLVAAFAYPIGNHIVGYARHGSGTRFGIPHITEPLFHKSAFSRIMLVTLGSVPFWIVLGLAVKAPIPAPTQIGYTALVALFSGVIATGFFWRARHAAHNVPYRVATLDSTQAAEALFTTLGGTLLFGEPLPGWHGCMGMALVVIGIFFFTLFEKNR